MKIVLFVIQHTAKLPKKSNIIAKGFLKVKIIYIPIMARGFREESFEVFNM